MRLVPVFILETNIVSIITNVCPSSSRRGGGGGGGVEVSSFSVHYMYTKWPVKCLIYILEIS